MTDGDVECAADFLEMTIHGERTGFVHPSRSDLVTACEARHLPVPQRWAEAVREKGPDSLDQY